MHNVSIYIYIYIKLRCDVLSPLAALASEAALATTAAAFAAEAGSLRGIVCAALARLEATLLEPAVDEPQAQRRTRQHSATQPIQGELGAA